MKLRLCRNFQKTIALFTILWMFHFSLAPFAIAQEEIVFVEGVNQYIPVVPVPQDIAPSDVIEIPPPDDGLDLGEFLVQLGDDLQSFFSLLGDKLGGAFKGIFGALGDKFKEGFGKLGGILGGLSDKLGKEDGIGGLFGKMQGAFGKFAGETKDTFGKLGGILGGKGEGGLGKLGGIFDEVKGGLSKIFGNLKGNLADIFAELKEKLPPSVREEVDRAESETDTEVEELRAATEAAVDAAEEEACRPDPEDPNRDPCSDEPAPDATAEGPAEALGIGDKNPGGIGAFFSRLGERLEEFILERPVDDGGIAHIYQELGASLNESFNDLGGIFQELFDVLGVAAGDVNGDGLRGSFAEFAGRIQGIFGSLAGQIQALPNGLMEEEGIYYFIKLQEKVDAALQDLTAAVNTFFDILSQQAPPSLQDEVEQARILTFADLESAGEDLKDKIIAIQALVMCELDPKSCSTTG